MAAPAALVAPLPQSEYAFRPVDGVTADDFFDNLVQKGRTAYERAIGELNKVAERITKQTQTWDARNATLVAGTVTPDQEAELKRDIATYTLEREKREQAKKLIKELEELISKCEPVEETPEVAAFKIQLAKLKIELRGVEAAHNALFVTTRSDLVAKKATVEKVLRDIEGNWVPFRTSIELFAKHCGGYTGVTGFLAHQVRRVMSVSWTPLALERAAAQDATIAALTE